jgi:hypothetical protein
MASESNSPAMVFKAKGVRVSIFHNVSGSSSWHRINIHKAYREQDQWKTTTSLNRDDIPIARMLMNRAWKWILDAESVRPNSTETAPEGAK